MEINETSFAPIALFVYNRIDHIKKTVEALKKNIYSSDSELFIFSDAARNINSENGVQEVRKYIKSISGFKNIKIYERKSNYGLAKSIIDGVTEIVNKFGKIIVLEDDIVTSPYFLKYMNDGLNMYKNIESVISIHGYCYPVDCELSETFFIKGADCWGWATWKRGWDIFEADGQKLLNSLKQKRLTREFDFNGTYPYTKMLKNQVLKKNNSWAIRWYASAFLENKLTLYPGKSLVCNIGFDNSGTHCGNTTIFDINLSRKAIAVDNIKIEQNKVAVQKFEKYFKCLKQSKIKQIIRRIKCYIRRIKCYI